MKANAFVLAVLGAAGVAQAQLNVDFENPPYNGSPAGVILTGQDGWTLPAGTDQFVYSYVGNALALPQNPTGGNQFIGGTVANATFLRGQHTNNFGSASAWSIGYDDCAAWRGTAPAAINLSSFSLQNSVTDRFFIALNNFMDVANPNAGWKAEYNVFDATGLALNNQSAGAAWTNLLVEHWYRQTAVIDFTTNQIMSVSITDLTTNTTTTNSALGWFMAGGANSALPIPSAVRFFNGGSNGDTMGWDNLSINAIPAPGAATLLALGLAAGVRRRR